MLEENTEWAREGDAEPTRNNWAVMLAKVMNHLRVRTREAGRSDKWKLHRVAGTGVPYSQNTTPPYDPTVGLCLGPYGGPSRRRFLMSEEAL